jgi:myo-inositol 2-dehydrogenase/D-chiro-inositol 1-dehydrogenase
MKTIRPVTRRSFLLKSAAAFAGVQILPSRIALAGPGAPSNTLNHAIIGCGGIAQDMHFNAHIARDGHRIVALCDVDAKHLANYMNQAKGRGKPCDGYRDFREVLARGDVDIVHVCTPPHWHGVISAMAAQAGCDVWCEKPMTRTIGEGRKVIQAIQRHGRMFRVNTWFRLGNNNYYGFGKSKDIRKACASGLLGWPLTVRATQSAGINWKARQWLGRTDLKPQPVPAEMDWDMYVGPSPMKPYHPHRTHGHFRGYWDYDGGGLADMGQHYLDPIQYFLGKDDTSPVEISARSQCPAHPEAVQMWDSVEMTYADGCRIIFESENVKSDREMPFIEGPKGRLYKNFRFDPPELAEAVAALPDPPAQVDDFIQSVKTRRKFGLNEESSNRSCHLVNLANIAIRLGRKLRFNPVTEHFVNDDEANRLVDQPLRAPWQF